MARTYFDKTAIIVPYMGDDDMPQYMRIQLDTPEGIDRRKLLRATRKFLMINFGVKVSNDFVRRCCQIINQHDVTTQAIPKTREEKREIMDRLVIALQEEEDNYAAQAGGYSISEAEAIEEAELDMPVVQEVVTRPAS